jgi:hypothetical protein
MEVEMSEKTAMEKLASDPRAQQAGKMLEKLGYDVYMANVQNALQKRAEGEELPVEGAGDIEELARAIQEDPDSVPDDIKEEFIQAVMGEPELQEEVKEAMARVYSKDMYKNAFYNRAAKDGQLRKIAEEIAAEETPQGEEVPEEMVQAIMEIIEEAGLEGGEGGEEDPMAEDLTEEDLAPEAVSEALAIDGDPIVPGDSKEAIAMKVAALAERNLHIGRVKTAQAIYDRYLR